MKKITALLTALLIATSTVSISIVAASLYNDISETDWYYENVSLLSSYQIINGYSDGTYQPSKTMQADEFIKTVVAAARHYDIETSTTGYWADPYIARAIEEGYVLEGEFSDYKQAITRGQMSNIIARALPVIGLEEFDSKSVWQRYEMVIEDFSSISSKQQDNILKVYSKGVLGGYPDGSFQADKSLTRAEASAVLSRLIIPSSRLAVATISDEDWQAYQDGGLGTEIVDGVQFNPVSDTDGYYNIVNGDVVNDLWDISFDELQFYIGDDGLVHVKGYVPNAPDGYHTGYKIEIETYTPMSISQELQSSKYFLNVEYPYDKGTKVALIEGEHFDKTIPTTSDNIHRIFVRYEVIDDNRDSSGTYVYLNYELRLLKMFAHIDINSGKEEIDLPIEWGDVFEWLK